MSDWKVTETGLNRVLAKLREDYRAVERVGDLSALRRRLATHEARVALEEHLRDISYTGEILQDAIAHYLSASGSPIAAVSPELWRFYETEFAPNYPALRSIYSSILMRDIFGKETGEGEEEDVEYVASPAGVGDAFEIAINILDDKWHSNDVNWGIEQRDVEWAMRIARAGFFRPKEWAENQLALRPVISSRPFVDFPVHVRVRLVEIFHSFVFGNWLAVLSLCRSLLEYCLIDRSSSFSIDPYEEVGLGKRQTKRLAVIIDEFSDRLPSAREPMKTVREMGNHAMHPRKDYDVIRFPAILRKDALRCVNATRALVALLYGPRGPVENR